MKLGFAFNGADLQRLFFFPPTYFCFCFVWSNFGMVNTLLFSARVKTDQEHRVKRRVTQAWSPR